MLRARVAKLTNKLHATRFPLKANAAVQFRKGPGAHVGSYAGYVLALRGASSTASAQSAVVLLAGTSEQGSVKDKKTLYAFEQRAAAAKNVRSSLLYAEYFGDGCDAESHLIQSDSTSHECLEQAKMFMSIVSSMGVQNIGHLDFSLNLVERYAASSRLANDLVKVKNGSGIETYYMLIRSFNLVDCPTWVQRKEVSANFPDRMSNYTFGGDGGSENPKSTAIGLACIEAVPNVTLTLAICLFHTVQLIILMVIDVLNDFVFEIDPLPANYYKLLCTVGYTWRSCGVPSMVSREAALQLPPEAAGAARRFLSAPEKPIRGRWGSIDKLETALMIVIDWMAPVLGAVFSALVRKRPRPSKDEEAREFQEQQFKFRERAAHAVISSRFKAMLVVSHVVKATLIHFLQWGEKRVREYNKAKAEATLEGRSYLGPTPLSKFVSTTALKMNSDILGLLSIEAEETLFAKAFMMIPQVLYGQLRELIIKLVLTVAVHWHIRMLSRVSSLTLQLLLIVETLPDVEDPVRKCLADRLLSTEDCCLRHPHSDVPRKWKHFYRDDFEEMKRTGTCSRRLYINVLIWRSTLPMDNQELEGVASLIQAVAKRAPNSKIQRVSDRLNLTKGDSINPGECDELHAQVLRHMQTDEYKSRFNLVIGPAEVPPPFRTCMIHASPNALNAVRYAAAIMKNFKADAGTVWTFDGPGAARRNGFIAAVKYKYVGYVVATSIRADADGGLSTVTLTRPIVPTPIIEFVREHVPLVTLVGLATATLYHARFTWHSIAGHGSYDMASEASVAVTPAKRQASSAAAAAAPAPAPAPAGAPAPADDDEMERWLEQVMDPSWVADDDGDHDLDAAMEVDLRAGVADEDPEAEPEAVDLAPRPACALDAALLAVVTTKVATHRRDCEEASSEKKKQKNKTKH